MSEEMLIIVANTYLKNTIVNFVKLLISLNTFKPIRVKKC